MKTGRTGSSVEKADDAKQAPDLVEPASRWLYRGALAGCVFGAVLGCGNDGSSAKRSDELGDASVDGSWDAESGSNTGGSAPSGSGGRTGSGGSAGSGGAADASAEGSADAAEVPEAAADTTTPIEAATDATAATTDAGDASISKGLVASGAELAIWGLTTDDHVVYFDGADRTFYVKSLDGGDAVALRTPEPGGTGFVNVYGDMVYLQTWGNNPGWDCQLVQWSSGLAAPVPVSNQSRLSYTYTVWGSEDASHSVYLRNLSNDGALGALYGLDADGTGETLLVDGLTTQPASCLPRVKVLDRHVVATYCRVPPQAGDGGAAPDAGSAAPIRYVQAFSLGDGWSSGVRVESSVSGFVVDPAETTLVTAAAATGYRLQAFPLEGGAPGPILDPDTAIFEFQTLYRAGTDPWYAAYNTNSGAVRRASPEAADGGPSVDILLPSGMDALYASSRSGHWLVGSSAFGSPFLQDLRIVSTQSPGNDHVVATLADFNDLPFGIYLEPSKQSFTKDDQYLLFFSDLGLSGLGAPVGFVRSASFDDPETSRRLSLGPAVELIPISGSELMMLDNYTESPNPTADITYVDAAGSGDAAVLATGVPVAVLNGGVILGAEATSDGTRVVYAQTEDDAPGIYWRRIPGN